MQNTWQLRQPWPGGFARAWLTLKRPVGPSVCCFTVTQFIKGQELNDKNHLLYGIWMGKAVPWPCSLLRGPNALAPSLKPPSFLCQGPPCLVAAHTEGPQSPGGLLQVTPPPPGPHLESASPLSFWGPPFTLWQLTSLKAAEGFGLSMQDSK